MVNNLNHVRQQLSNTQNELQSAVNQLNAQKAQLQGLQQQQKVIAYMDQEIRRIQAVIQTALQQTMGNSD